VSRPTLSWFPVRHLIEEVEGRGDGDAWIGRAASFGFAHVEVHAVYVQSTEREASVRARLEEAGVNVSQITCAPDLVNPDAANRQRELESMRDLVAVAARLGASYVRVTAGIDRPTLNPDEAIRSACECLRRLGEAAERLDVTLCLENHFRDRSWPADAVDFSLPPERFLALVDALRDSPVLVNFDSAQTMLSGVDPVELLPLVVDRVANFHAGDRIRGERHHAVIGEGDVDFDRIFEQLARHGYTGFVTVEDGSGAGDEGLRRAVAYLGERVERCFGGVSA
jgi:sugar phosphate isomerase/epimerase